MQFKDYKNLTEEEKQFWQFEQLACISSLKLDMRRIEKRMNFVYAWATGLAGGISFIFLFVKTKFFN